LAYSVFNELKLYFDILISMNFKEQLSLACDESGQHLSQEKKEREEETQKARQVRLLEEKQLQKESEMFLAEIDQVVRPLFKDFNFTLLNFEGEIISSVSQSVVNLILQWGKFGTDFYGYKGAHEISVKVWKNKDKVWVMFYAGRRYVSEIQLQGLNLEKIKKYIESELLRVVKEDIATMWESQGIYGK